MTERTALPPVRNPPTLIESAFTELPSGVAAICALSDSGPIGMMLDCCAAASLDPPLLSISVPAMSAKWRALALSARIGLNVLWGDQLTGDTNFSQSDACRLFDWGWQANENGAVFLSEVPTWFECSIYTEVLLGDQAVALLRVHSLKISAFAPRSRNIRDLATSHCLT